MTPGARVRIALPPDVESWSGEPGRSWLATVVAVNGDSIDVRDDAGEVEPVDAEYVTLERRPSRRA